MYVYPPPTRLVIRKYAVHVRSGVITGSAVVLRVHCALYRRCFCFFSLCFNVAARGKKKIAKPSRQQQQQQQPPSRREAAVRRQLFVYLDLTCNYICDRLGHRLEAQTGILFALCFWIFLTLAANLAAATS